MDATDKADEAGAPPRDDPLKRRRGRPKGYPKTGGRKKDTPNWSAAEVRNQLLRIDGIAELARIIEGKPIRVTGPTGKAFDAYATIDQKLKALEIYLKKLSPDLASTAVTGADHTGPMQVERSSRDLARSVLDILRTATLTDEAPDPVAINEAHFSSKNGQLANAALAVEAAVGGDVQAAAPSSHAGTDIRPRPSVLQPGECELVGENGAWIVHVAEFGKLGIYDSAGKLHGYRRALEDARALASNIKMQPPEES